MARSLIAHVRRHAVAYLALFVSLGGTSYAVSSLPPNSVDTEQIVDGAVTARKVGRLPAVSAFSRAFHQQVPASTLTPIHLDEEQFDTGAMHGSARDTRLVARRAGTYVVQGRVLFANQGACGGPSRLAAIRRHRSDGKEVNVDTLSSGTRCGDHTRVHVGGIVRLRAGEYVELLARQCCVGNMDVAGRLSAAFVGG